MTRIETGDLVSWRDPSGDRPLTGRVLAIEEDVARIAVGDAQVLTLARADLALCELKMWLAVRTDLPFTSGKLAVQAGHAFRRAFVDAQRRDPARAARYVAMDEPKIVVRVKSLAELERVAAQAESAGLAHALVEDLGRTVFEGPTRTVCAFGPCERERLPAALARLRLFE